MRNAECGLKNKTPSSSLIRNPHSAFRNSSESRQMRPCLPKSPQVRKTQASKARKLKRAAQQRRKRKSNKRSVHVATNLQTLRKRLRQRASGAQTSPRGSFAQNFQAAQ